MAIIERTTQRCVGTGQTGSSVTITFPATPIEGNLLVVAVGWREANSNAEGLTGWSSAGVPDHGNAIYYKIAGPSEPTSFTFGVSANTAGIAAVGGEWSGIDPTSPLDLTMDDEGNTSSLSIATEVFGPLNQADELVIVSFFNFNTATWSAYTNGLSEIGQAASAQTGSAVNRINIALTAKIVNVVDAVVYEATLSESRFNNVRAASFKAALPPPTSSAAFFAFF